VIKNEKVSESVASNVLECESSGDNVTATDMLMLLDADNEKDPDASRDSVRDPLTLSLSVSAPLILRDCVGRTRNVFVLEAVLEYCAVALTVFETDVVLETGCTVGELSNVRVTDCEDTTV
jgi:hypothetical protein